MASGNDSEGDRVEVDLSDDHDDEHVEFFDIVNESESKNEYIFRLPLRKLKISDDDDQVEKYGYDFLPMLIASIKKKKRAER